MYHLIGVVYRIRRYTGVYRLPCMLLFPDLFCLVNQFKQKHAAQAVSSQAVEGSTLQKGSSHQYIYCKLSLISYVFAQCPNNPKAGKQSSHNIERGTVLSTDDLHPFVTDITAWRLRWCRHADVWQTGRYLLTASQTELCTAAYTVHIHCQSSYSYIDTYIKRVIHCN